MLSGNSPCDFGEKHINGTIRSRHRRYARASSPGELAKMEALCSDEPAMLQIESLKVTTILAPPRAKGLKE